MEGIWFRNCENIRDLVFCEEIFPYFTRNESKNKESETWRIFGHNLGVRVSGSLPNYEGSIW